MRIPAYLASMLLAGALGCRSSAVPPDCLCTMSFAFVSVTVVDNVGAPVAGLSPTITLLRTGEHIVPAGPSAGAGQYVVFTDTERPKIDADGDTLRFTATLGSRSATGDFVIDVPGQCRCHIRKAAGPDTLVMH